MTTSSTDITELFSSPIVSTIAVTYKGKTWEFTYRRLPWEAYLNALEAAWVSVPARAPEEAPGLDFKPGAFYREALAHALVTGPNGTPMTPELVRRLDLEVVLQLRHLVPGPQLIVELNRAKKD